MTLPSFVRPFVVAALLCFAAPALAQSAPPSPPGDARAAAAAMKKQADAAMDTLHYDEALASYQRSYELFPDPAVLYNEARVYQARGEYPEALSAGLRFEQEAPAELKARVAGLSRFLDELREHVATLDLRCNISGARVLVREKQIGVTPLPQSVKLNAGKPLLEVVAEGYLPFHEEVDLRGGVTTPLEVMLKSKDRAGTLAIRVDGDPATVQIDHALTKMTPLELQLDAGPHSIVIRREGFEDLDTSTVVVAGQRKELALSLAHKKPLTARWWFWTGVGPVVVGTAVTAVVIALNTEKAHGSGDQFSPGVQSAPLMKW